MRGGMSLRTVRGPLSRISCLEDLTPDLEVLTPTLQPSTVAPIIRGLFSSSFCVLGLCCPFSMGCSVAGSGGWGCGWCGGEEEVVNGPKGHLRRPPIFT